MNPFIICCHTGEERYVSDCKRMVKSANKFNYEVYVEELKSGGSWQADCALKPSFILRCIQRFGSRPLVWVDADGEIMKHFDAFEDPYYDMGIPWNPGKKFYEFSSGTMYFNPSGKHVIPFLEEWGVACQEVIEGKHFKIDQLILYEVWKKSNNVPITEFLGQGYVKVFDHDWRSLQNQVEYVRHHQASREIRKFK